MSRDADGEEIVSTNSMHKEKKEEEEGEEEKEEKEETQKWQENPCCQGSTDADCQVNGSNVKQ